MALPTRIGILDRVRGFVNALPDTLTVEVTQGDIDNGGAFSARDCVMARAIRRATGGIYQVHVGGLVDLPIRQAQVGPTRYRLSDAAMVYVRENDHARPHMRTTRPGTVTLTRVLA